MLYSFPGHARNLCMLLSSSSTGQISSQHVSPWPCCQHTSAWLLPSLEHMDTLPMTPTNPAISSAVGRPVVWTSRHREDPAGTGCGPPHRLHLHPGVWVRAGAEVHWRGVAHGPRAVCHGQVGLLPVVAMDPIGLDLHGLECKQSFAAIVTVVTLLPPGSLLVSTGQHGAWVRCRGLKDASPSQLPAPSALQRLPINRYPHDSTWRTAATCGLLCRQMLAAGRRCPAPCRKHPPYIPLLS